MTGGPAVSVVIPVFNGSAYLSDALESVAGQTVDDYELIVVDDGSTDGTGAIVARYAKRDSRIVPVSQPNRGPATARNAGLQGVRGELVAFLDADDVWLPEKLERQIAHLDSRPNCEACFTHFEEVDDALRVTTPWSELRNLWPLDSVGPDLLVERGNLIAGSDSSVTARTRAVKEAGGFDERLTAAEDLDLWYRLALRAPLEAVPEVLVRIRRHSDQMQEDFSRVLEGRIQFLENVKRLNDVRHIELARPLERRLRRQLLRRSLRRWQLRRGAMQLRAIVSNGGPKGSA